VGLKNFVRAFTLDDIFLKSFANNIVYILGTFLTEVAFGLGVAILLARPYKVFGILRTFFFSPFMISMVAVGLLWGFVFDNDFALLNGILSLVGLSVLARPWLADSSTALAAVTVASGWKYASFYMVIFYAALQQIPRDVYEAASIDGASEWRQITHITIPLLFPMLRVALLLCISGGFAGAFDIFYTMTQGGPFHATEIPSTWIVRHAFDRHNMGYGAALTLILTLVTMAISFVYLRAVREKK